MVGRKQGGTRGRSHHLTTTTLRRHTRPQVRILSDALSRFLRLQKWCSASFGDFRTWVRGLSPRVTLHLAAATDHKSGRFRDRFGNVIPPSIASTLPVT